MYHHTDNLKLRNRNLILVLGYTGIRKSEALNLLVGDVDFNRRIITVRQRRGYSTKNRKDRSIPIADRIVEPLREQCAGKATHDKVFGGLNSRSVYRIINKLALAAGLEGFHPHSLRHFFGTTLVERGANLRVVQELMGHGSIEVTAVYLDVTATHLRQAVNLLEHYASPCKGTGC